GRSVETLVPGGSRGFHKGHRETYNRDPRVRPMGIGLELRAQTKSGALLPVEISLSPGHEDGAPAVIAVIRDVTERSRVEEKLRRSEEKLRQAEKLEALARLAGGTAHEFNNLLTMIMGYAELLEADFSGQKKPSAHLQKIRLASKRAANLTRQLLAFGRRQMLSPQILDMNAIIADAGQVLSRVIREGTKTVVITAAKPAWVRADSAQIELMIANLASNAHDAMPHGGTLSISVQNLELADDDIRQHHGLAPGPYVLLSFADTGVGMPPEVQARIFEPFFSTREFGKAAGLGLATVYGIVTQSGGTISVHSQLGVGTTFNVYLPRLTEEQAALRAAVPPTMEELAGSGTILLVEDQPHLLELSREFLQRLGYVVLPASNGEQAVDIAGSFQGRIDLLLTDIVMPGMNGRQLSNQLRAARPVMKVLYVSGYTDEVFGEQGISSGEAFMEKPFDLETLGQQVKQVLRPATGPVLI
ncbi:MAG TPA: response regulator, partial [Candidatus Angelobacter sp.]|nr:response regulator [Candidatus Angelobacter sp.]